jgi:2-keto-4-pentenoate hydratase/2-oxohepta-3-ene-1,7-dioic acid hydratase in catechol pathway
MFLKSPNAIADHSATVQIPKIAQNDQADYEGELAVIIGKDCKNASEETVMEYIFGYAVANDVSARYEYGKWPTFHFEYLFCNRRWQNDVKIWGA